VLPRSAERQPAANAQRDKLALAPDQAPGEISYRTQYRPTLSRRRSGDPFAC